MLQTEIYKWKALIRQTKAHGWQPSVSATQNTDDGVLKSCKYMLSAMLRGVIDDSTRKLALTLTESGYFVGWYAIHFARLYAHYYKKSNSLIRLQAGRVWLRVRKNNNHISDNECISSIIERLQLNAGFGKKIQRMQHRKQRLNPVWLRRYREDLMAVAAESSTSDVNALNAFNNTTNLASCHKLCSASVIVKWIDQQRANLQAALTADDSNVHSTPALLGLSYRNSIARENVPILLLDNSIQLSGSSASLYQAHSDNNAVSRTAATVMVSAIRTAAELELPVNMVAVMQLTHPQAKLALPKTNFEKSSGDRMLIVNLHYEPQSICDVPSFGTAATISLIFNKKFHIWRHYHLLRDVTNGKLAPLWFLAPQHISTDYSGNDLHDLLSLAAYNIVPHILWQSRHGNRAYRTTVRFRRM